LLHGRMTTRPMSRAVKIKVSVFSLPAILQYLQTVNFRTYVRVKLVSAADEKKSFNGLSEVVAVDRDASSAPV